MRSIRQIALIARREAVSLATAPSSYFLLALYLLLGGILFVDELGSQRYANLQAFFAKLGSFFIFLIPAVTGSAFAEENRRNIDSLYVTAAVRPRALVWGKFLGLMTFVTTAVILTTQYPLMLAAYASPDRGPVIGALFGLWLLGTLVVSTALFVSTLSPSHLITTIGGMTLSLVFWWAVPIGEIPGGELGAEIAGLSSRMRFEVLVRGVVDSGDVSYFLLMSLIFLAAATRGVEARRW